MSKHGDDMAMTCMSRKAQTLTKKKFIFILNSSLLRRSPHFTTIAFIRYIKFLW